jgi:hypothetical protein
VLGSRVSAANGQVILLHISQQNHATVDDAIVNIAFKQSPDLAFVHF